MRFPLATSMADKSRTSFSSPPDDSVPMGFEFEFGFSARFASSGSGETGSMISANELFLNGQIRPMKLSTHLERPQPPAASMNPEELEGRKRGRDLRFHRRTRSFSPLRNIPDFGLITIHDPTRSSEKDTITKIGEEIFSDDSSPSLSSTLRSLSAGRSSNRWVFLKDFLIRSKSEGRKTNNKFWSNISFRPSSSSENRSKKSVNGVSVRKRRVPPSSHEVHYTANRAQAEELRKRTFLPYREGLFGCLGFSSKGYGAMSGFAATALNPPVSF